MPATSYVEWKIMGRVHRYEFPQENAVVAAAAQRYASVFEPPIPADATLDEQIIDFIEKNVAQITRVSVRVLVNQKRDTQTGNIEAEAEAEGSITRPAPPTP